MNTILHAARLGISRGWIEFKQSMTTAQDVGYYLFMNGALLLVLVLQRSSEIAGMSLALLTLPSVIGMTIASGGVMGAASQLAADREDGTLLRAKAIPQGIVGYLVGRIVLVTLTTVVGLLIILIPGFFLIEGLGAMGMAGWLQFVLIFVVGLLATLPWGAIVGSIVKSSGSGFGLTFLAIGGITAISGIFYPIMSMPGWVQAIAQVFPVYWLGLGMRSAFLPDSAASVELAKSWQPTETFVVLGIWAIIGFLIAPRILRRMARRESGSTMEARKQEVLTRGY